MVTIRTFFNPALAGLACSVLRAADIDTVLADLNAYTLGPQYVPWGIRLQVPESDADQAERILDHLEGFPPLPDDFVPPPESFLESAPLSQDAGRAMDAFLRGGAWAATILFVFVIVNVATGHRAHAAPGRVALAFALGGVIGLFVHGIDSKRRKRNQ
jgi:hypothetical protein